MPQIQISDDFNKLEVTLYGDMEKLTDTLSKARVRIFYKGLNRNRTFISDDFANQLISSLPYAPVKGIFNYADVDFEDHGENNTDGRIYGIVAAEPNFAWEKHLDVDGVEREYCCADVIIYSALYPEAKIIKGKSQSMEIYKNTMQGEWRTWEDGLPYFHFQKGCLLGLQVLGDSTEPCFEGSSFFSLYDNARELYDYIKINKQEENKEMTPDKSLFRFSDSEKADKIWEALNPNFNEAGEWKIDMCLMDVYDDYAICHDNANNKFVRVYYTKDNTANSVTIGDMVDVSIVDVTASELTALETMKAIGGTYEKSAETFSQVQADVTSLNETVETMKANETTLNSTIATDKETIDSLNSNLTEVKTELEQNKENYTTQINELTAEKTVLVNEKNDLIKEKEALEAFKLNIEKQNKEAILGKFAMHLSEDEVNAFKEKMGDYSVEDFEKELCITAYKTNPSLFSKQEQPDLIYKGEIEKDFGVGALGILNKYKNGGNK